ASNSVTRAGRSTDPAGSSVVTRCESLRTVEPEPCVRRATAPTLNGHMPAVEPRASGRFRTYERRVHHPSLESLPHLWEVRRGPVVLHRPRTGLAIVLIGGVVGVTAQRIDLVPIGGDHAKLGGRRERRHHRPR